MTISVICQLWEFIKTHVVTNVDVYDERFHVMEGCASCFYLWLRIDEFFRLQFKNLKFNVDLKPHLATCSTLQPCFLGDQTKIKTARDTQRCS